jgi:hypothetical protein
MVASLPLVTLFYDKDDYLRLKCVIDVDKQLKLGQSKINFSNLCYKNTKYFKLKPEFLIYMAN